MLTTIDDVIASLDKLPTNSEKGTKFEELMVGYFAHDPMLSSQYKNVSRWIDWAHRGSTADVGIDLVAQDRATDEWTAIQCKFYAPTQPLAKSSIDSFFTASGKSWDGVGFTNRIIISTTDKWTSHAEDALDDQAIPVQRIGLPEIAASPIDWVVANPARPLDLNLARGTRFAARPHQVSAIEKILEGFASSDRGQWISACGTGKTFTSLKLAESMAKEAGGGFGCCSWRRRSSSLHRL
ncbi:restriction endonuclease [Tessaracoccus palaemonis]|uniref:DEAD/DEAH box helicase family protein n=1 Tax=Tessaracoccus palaemonis TaxID=2829499 RepID=A0ABX8SJ17_9ACTN|nr:DEAD/DEAH box helicase family protein [Tessaracoccus palaemonis]QXT61978.1 DEAD/DEAH box helicase family protein [Tessaracoccus palaemonis]